MKGTGCREEGAARLEAVALGAKLEMVQGGGTPDALQSMGPTHRRPFVGVSHARSWSRLPVVGAILWKFIAKSYQNLPKMTFD